MLDKSLHSLLWAVLLIHAQFIPSRATTAVIDLGLSFAVNRTFSICHNVAFNLNGCYTFHPSLTSACGPPRGYEHEVRGNFTTECDDLTLCCRVPNSGEYSDVSDFAAILNNRRVRNLKSVGCNFTDAAAPFVTIRDFNTVEIKNPRGVTELDIRVDDLSTQRWLDNFPERGFRRKSVLHVATDIFTYMRDGDTRNVLKGYSFLSNTDTKDIVSVAYYG